MFFKRAIILMVVICNILSEGSPVSSSGAGLREPRSALQNANNLHKKAKTCSSTDCKAAATLILKNMDTTVDPCDNFYQFACGKFVNRSKSTDPENSVSLMANVQMDVLNDLSSVLAEPESHNEIKPFKMIKMFYKLCMDTIRIDELGVEPMKKVLSRLGGWPLLESNWDEESFDWQESVWKLRQENFPFDYILNFTIGPDSENPTEWIIKIDQPSLGIKTENLERGWTDTNVESYYSKMLRIAEEFGANLESASEDLRKALEFEIALARISDTDEERSNPSKLYNPMSISEMQEKFPTISWLKYINKILAPEDEVSDNEKLIVGSPNYIQKLEKLLSTTSKRTQANYIMWRAVASAIPYLSANIRKYQLDFDNELTDDTGKVTSSMKCALKAATIFSVAAGSLYVRQFFTDEDARKDAIAMVEAIRDEMNNILNSAKWMGKKTKKSALEKCEAIISIIGYPNELLDDKKIEEYYSKHELPQNDFFSFMSSIRKFKHELAISKLHKKNSRIDWTLHSQTFIVNAGYAPTENSMEVLAAILQGFLYSKDRPKYINYGGIGAVIGHEMTHGFDDEGRMYDKDGKKTDWWDSKTATRFNQKAECLIKQYGSYIDKETGMNVNGSLTLGENIADNGGIKQAYYAYQTWVKKNGPEPRLPGLEKYSPQQIFWLSYANIWCTTYTHKDLMEMMQSVHPPNGMRVIGTLSNQKEFAKDFNCPSGSKMNPEKKCVLW